MNAFYTDFLAPSGSFLIGAGAAFNISGEYFSLNRSANRELADARAIRQDFAVVGQDIAHVLVTESAKLPSTRER
jgi:hypothetical protein